MVNIRDMVDGKAAKARRMRLGISQADVAERVAKISGKKFSQQALGKFENTSSSAYAIYILKALDEFEQESGLGFLETEPAYEVRESIAEWRTDDLERVLDQIIDGLDREEALEVATRVMQRALAIRGKRSS